MGNVIPFVKVQRKPNRVVRIIARAPIWAAILCGTALGAAVSGALILLVGH